MTRRPAARPAVRAVIVDDEQLARERIRRLLRDESDVEVVAECEDGESAVAAIREHRPDLVFLDVQMPGLDGFGVLDALGADAPDRPPMPVVIFVTAYDQYALRAFDVHALDYLVKPYNPQRFRDAVARSRAYLTRDRASHEGRLLSLVEQLSAEKRELERRLEAPGGRREAPGPVDRLMLRAGGRIFFVKADEVDWIETAGNYVRVHIGQEAHLLRESLTTLAARLDPARFARIHRTTLVNIDRIREVQPWFSGDYVVILRSGAKLKMSRNYRGLIESGNPGERGEGS